MELTGNSKGITSEVRPVNKLEERSAICGKLGNAVPQINQQYRTADRHFHINDDGEVHDHFPIAQIALRFNDHNFGPYRTALTRIRDAQTPQTRSASTASGTGSVSSVSSR